MCPDREAWADECADRISASDRKVGTGVFDASA
jgi:hypothetical protein